MHKEGHHGTVLLVFAPVALLLASLGYVVEIAIGFMVLNSLAMLPDIDMRIPLIKHRGITHTIWFALAVGLAIGLAAAYSSTFIVFWRPVDTVWHIAAYGLYGFLLGLLAVFGHVLGDVVTVSGVKFFYPVSNKKYRVENKWLNLPTLASSDLANYLFILTGLSAFIISVVVGLHISSFSLPF